MQVNTSSSIDCLQEVASIVCSLKKIADKLQLTIILFSGLCREIETRIDHKPILCDLNNSGCPADYLDIALFLYRNDYYNKYSKCPDTTELIVTKNNFGNTGTIF